MKVVEKFISINGEGLKSGELTAFIRFNGCNCNCSYCDTTYANGDECKEENVSQIVYWVNTQNVKNVTLTGGEPLEQDHKELVQLIKLLIKSGVNYIEIETNGTYNIDKFESNFKLTELSCISSTIDYKLPSSGQEDKMCIHNLMHPSKRNSFKFVIGSEEDLDKTYEIITKYELQSRTNVLLSPVFGQMNPKRIVEFMKENNLNRVRLQLQLHKIIWDPNKRGV